MADVIRLEYGIAWVRTACTEAELDLLGGDLFEMTALADDISASVLDATGGQVCMQANGWAACPRGWSPERTREAIDTALAVVLEGAAA